MLPAPEKRLSDEGFSGSTREDMENEFFEIKSDSTNKHIIEDRCDCKTESEGKLEILEEKVITDKVVIKKINLLEYEANIIEEIAVKENIQMKLKEPPKNSLELLELKQNKIKEYDSLEYNDPEKGLVKYKTRIIQSSDKLVLQPGKKRNNKLSIANIPNILKFSNIPINKFKFEDLDTYDCNCDIKTFYWDNLDNYYSKKAKREIKDSTESPISSKV